MRVLTWERQLPTKLFILKSFQLRFTNAAGCSAFTVQTDSIFNVHILFATLCQQSCYQHGCHIFGNIWYLVNTVCLICLPFSVFTANRNPNNSRTLSLCIWVDSFGITPCWHPETLKIKSTWFQLVLLWQQCNSDKAPFFTERPGPFSILCAHQKSQHESEKVCCPNSAGWLLPSPADDHVTAYQACLSFISAWQIVSCVYVF